MKKISHIRTIRHIFISIMIVLALHVMMEDLMDKGKIDLNFELIRWCFGNFSLVFYTWLYMKISTSCLVYYCFHSWATNRLYYLAYYILNNANKVKKEKEGYLNKIQVKYHLVLYDLVWLVVYIFYLVAFIILPAYVALVHKLPPASSMCLIMEQVRKISFFTKLSYFEEFFSR